MPVVGHLRLPPGDRATWSSFEMGVTSRLISVSERGQHLHPTQRELHRLHSLPRIQFRVRVALHAAEEVHGGLPMLFDELVVVHRPTSGPVRVNSASLRYAANND